MKKTALPLLLFVALLAFLALALSRQPQDLPSPLIGRSAPKFNLATLDGPSFQPQDMRGQVWLLNVWATWCVACRAEHPLLVEFSRAHQVAIVGLSYKELQGQAAQDRSTSAEQKLALARAQGQRWLQRHGNPYLTTVLDLDGRVGMDYGVYGVPETYVIDRAGVIRHKQVGALTPALLQDEILPLIQQLQAS
jgi:cytochrome c biogenesis protein CcmG/thiol:disulfide interchange protein DsbE